MKFKNGLYGLIALAIANVSANELPEVPASVLDVPEPSVSRDNTSAMDSSANITVKEGMNYIIPIAISHPNRIISPFYNPEVISTSLTGMKADGSCGEICVKDNVIYIATDKEVPVTAYITERGSQQMAISLTMVPKKIPPREVHLTFGEDSPQYQVLAKGNKRAEKWEQSQPYVETLKQLLRTIALQEVPQGYNSRKITDKTRGLPICKSQEVSTNFVGGQILQGHSFNVYIGVVQNITDRVVEVKEAMCGDWDVAAVSTFPNVILQPNEKTEIYVVKKVDYDKPIENFRPSLLD